MTKKKWGGRKNEKNSYSFLNNTPSGLNLRLRDSYRAMSGLWPLDSYRQVFDMQVVKQFEGPSYWSYSSGPHQRTLRILIFIKEWNFNTGQRITPKTLLSTALSLHWKVDRSGRCSVIVPLQSPPIINFYHSGSTSILTGIYSLIFFTFPYDFFFSKIQ